MTDYHPLIARAVEGLTKNTGEARRALYERARGALVTQLRGVEPALDESEITKERLALEDAIRKVEADAARKALSDPRAAPRAEPKFDLKAPGSSARRDRPGEPAAEKPDGETPAAPEASAPEPPPKPTARSRILEARNSSLTDGGLRGFRNVINEVDGLGEATARAARTARDTRDSYAPAARQRTPPPPEDLDPPGAYEPIEPHFEDEDVHSFDDADLHQPESLEPPYGLDTEEEEEQPAQRSARPQPPRPVDYEDEYEEVRDPRSYRDWIRIAVMLVIVLGVSATAWHYRSSIGDIYGFFSQLKSRDPGKNAQGPAPDSKFPGRVPQDKVPGAGGTPDQRGAPEVAQRAVLYEADANDPQGKRFVGSAIWRTETVSPGPGLAPELVVRADIAIPERHMTVTWSLRRNTDKALPASHTVEIMFNLPPDFPGGGISNVPGILMKDTEEVRGMPLAGLAVKVTNGFFLIGLNAADSEMQRNLQLLKERPWFDILMVYNNGGRAILTMEKGPPGDRSFAEAFSAWGQ